MFKVKKRSKPAPRREGVTDFHVHIHPWPMLKPEVMELMRRGKPWWDRVARFSESPYELLKHLDQSGVERVCLVNDVSPDVTGATPEINDWVSRYCSEAPDRLLAVGSIHPRLVAHPEAEMERLCGDLKIRMIKIHPAHQLIDPNEYRDGVQALGVIYRKAQEYRIPVMIHTGTSILPGARIKHAQPIHCDDVGVDFPELTVILAHGGRPIWTDEAFFLVRRHANFHLDISGIPAARLLEYFPRLEEIADKVLYGSDWPGPSSPELGVALKEFEKLPISEAAREKILVTNARKLIP